MSYRSCWIDRIALLLSCVIATTVHAASDWESIQLPEDGAYATALAVGTEFIAVAVRNMEDDRLGVFRTSIDEPGAWESLGLEGVSVTSLIMANSSGSTVMASCSSGDDLIFYWSEPGGWVPRASGIDADAVVTLSGDRVNPSRVYASTSGPFSESGYGIATSDDDGQTWGYWQLCDNDCITSGIRGIDVKPFNDSVARATHFNGFWETELLITLDGGSEWEIILDHRFSDIYSVDLCARPYAFETDFYLLGPYGIVAWENGTWIGGYATPFSGSWGHLGIETPLWDPTRFYLAGVYEDGTPDVVVTEDPDLGWESIGGGLPPSSTLIPNQQWNKYQLVAAPDRPRLLLSLFETGLWILDLTGVVGVEYGVDRPTAGVVAYPNPSPGDVTIAVRGDRRLLEHSLRVVDVLGRVVQTLEVGSGVTTLRWNGRDRVGREVASGVYRIAYYQPDGQVGRSEPVLILR